MVLFVGCFVWFLFVIDMVWKVNFWGIYGSWYEFWLSLVYLEFGLRDGGGIVVVVIFIVRGWLYGCGFYILLVFGFYEFFII